MKGLLGIAIAGCLACGCGDVPDAHGAGPSAETLLVVDGDLVVRTADLEPFARYFEALDPTMGVKFRTRELLQQHLLPLLLARRAFPTERAELRRRAEELRSVADNALELQRKGELAGGRESWLSRNNLDLPVAAWAFEPEHLGAVSPPIETARGYVLIAPLQLEPGLTRVTDRLDAFVVEFATHEPAAFDAWLGEARRSVAGRVQHVAPSLEGTLPSWLLP